MSRHRSRHPPAPAADRGRTATIPPAGRVLGVDPGTVRVGIAVSDPRQLLASPLVTVPRGDDLARVLARLVREEKAVGIVVGLPLSLDGSAGPAALSVLDELEGLTSTAAVPVETHDERFTTVTATGHLQGAARRGEHTRRAVDQAAAAVMLQSWLDGRRSKGVT